MRKNSGFMIIEVLLAIVILTMVLLTVFSMVRVSQVGAQKVDYSGEMAILAQNAVEIAVDNLRNDWTIGYGNYFPAFDNDQGKWVLVSGEEENLEARFKRKISISSVCRDGATGELLDTVPCNETIDENSKQITVEVAWMEESFGSPLIAKLLMVNLE